MPKLAVRVWLLNVVLCAATVGLFQVKLISHDHMHLAYHLPWLVLVACFSLTYLFSIDLDVRRDKITISLAEIPLVIGLFLGTPIGVVSARVLGAVIVLGVIKRQPLIKMLFNLGMFALEVAIAFLVFNGLIGSQASIGPHGWVVALAATLTANVFGFVCVSCVIALNGGVVQVQLLRDVVIGLAATSVANTSIALGAATLITFQSEAVFLLVIIAAVAVGGYSAHSALKQRYANLQLLYTFLQTMHQAPPDDNYVERLLDSARALLRAEIAEVVVTSATTDLLRCSTVGPGNQAYREVLTSPEQLGSVWSNTLDQGALCIPHDSRDAHLKAWLARRGWQDAMIVPFNHDEQVVGTMAVSGRQGDRTTFNRHDLRLFEALVGHAAVLFEKSRLTERLRHDALHDALTGLPNRNLLSQVVERSIAARGPGDVVTVLLMDLDGFKDVNDTLGHHHGDQLLIEVGNRLLEILPTSATVARLGGDEFAVAFSTSPDNESPIVVAHQVRDQLKVPFKLGPLTVNISASVGIAIAPGDGEDAGTLLRKADVAMYSAKGGVGVQAYHSDRDQYSQRRLSLLNDLGDAITSGQMRAHFQPQADLRTGIIVGAEALVRWDHPDLGMIFPDEFIPLAERSGLIGRLTVEVLKQALAQHRAWREAGIALDVSVNLSARDILEGAIVGHVARLLSYYEVPAESLTLEITESSIVADREATLRVLQELYGMGVRLAVDDFGTGYSSLAYLQDFPVHEVKIDKSFVMTMATHDTDRAIVRSIIDLGRNLGLRVVAEGVVSQQVWDDLASLGCDFAQGYFLGKPMTPEDLSELCRVRKTSMELLARIY
jgi:diguanylate cyclase (GGDEF)-like protein